MNIRNTTNLDRFIIEVEHGLRTCFIKPPLGSRPYPAENQIEPQFDDAQKAHVAGLMRINNAGEVAAQGLYRGQAITARDQSVQQEMLEAAAEENEHLNWCQTRLQELDARTSLLDPIWYLGSFAIGATAGAMGDKWSLGFVEETENQVTEHLQEHLNKLPEEDQRSEKILSQMQEDEQRHAQSAHNAGAAELPEVIKFLMTSVSKVMKVTAYRL